MKRNIISFPLFFMLALAFMSISAMAQAVNSTTIDRFPIINTITACNGEEVVYEGFVQLVTHFTVSNSSQVNIKLGDNVNVKGVGQTTGANYVGNQTVQYSARFDSIDFAPFNFTETVHFNLFSIS